MGDSDEESAEVEDKQTDYNYHVAINPVNHCLKQLQLQKCIKFRVFNFRVSFFS